MLAMAIGIRDIEMGYRYLAGMVMLLAMPAGALAQARPDSLPPGVTMAMVEQGSALFQGRGLCANCGTPITFWTRTAPNDIDITLGSLDHPERVPATAHVWTSSKVDWLTVDPDLRAHPESSS